MRDAAVRVTHAGAQQDATWGLREAPTRHATHGGQRRGDAVTICGASRFGSRPARGRWQEQSQP
jgi:hypothetical protein